MTNVANPAIAGPNAAAEPADASPDRWMVQLGTLLKELENGPADASSLASTPEECTDDQLAKRRLGIASSLFAALQCKHATTAAHSMRVALDLLGLGDAAGIRRAAARATGNRRAAA